ncbi:hypothetical protein [Roseimarinus sediminis]|uniref:hypothetical protein n=1 Tax=Roseimarinus sediminis TaxID=1610899 RepID=UPI003D2387CF
MKRISYFLMGCIGFAIVNLILTGYGNKVVHPNINYSIYLKFQDNVEQSLASFSKFGYYVFDSNSLKKYTGEAVTSTGLLSVEEGLAQMNSLNWAIHGGFSADEPEVAASFRHFYNPTQPVGDRYLKNYLDVIKASDYFNYITDVEIDHLEWARDHPGHQYNWEAGKEMMVRAFTYFDQEEKDEAIAFAYRALGETLHMIADMGCPAHVRDDAHPGFTSIVSIDLGSPDVYEEYLEGFSDIENLFAKGKVDPVLKNTFQKANTLADIAIPLAEYTNRNFFTGQTIYGNKTSPIIHKGADFFRSPWLDDCSYNETNFTYYKEISGVDVMMCKDHYYSKYYKGYPYIDKECAQSQAAVLIPQILEAGANLYRLFIPEIKVDIKSYDQEKRIIKGEIKHIPDQEYPDELAYTGEILLYNSGTNKQIAKGQCMTGNFEIDFSDDLYKQINWEQDGIYAITWIGDFYVSSDLFNASLSEEEEEEEEEEPITFPSFMHFWFVLDPGGYDYTGPSMNFSFNDKVKLNWNGNNFSTAWELTRNNNYHQNGTISGSVSKNSAGKTVVSFEFSNLIVDDLWEKNETWTVKAKEVPFSGPRDPDIAADDRFVFAISPNQGSKKYTVNYSTDPPSVNNYLEYHYTSTGSYTHNEHDKFHSCEFYFELANQVY